MDVKPQHIDSYSVHIAPDLSTAVPFSEESVGPELFKICDAVIKHPSADVQVGTGLYTVNSITCR